jgi:hypothetical protein
LSDFVKSNETKISSIIREIVMGKSKIIILCGSRGGGKTSLAMFLAEELNRRNPYEKIFFVGEGIRKDLFPKWIKTTNNIESVPTSSIAIVDEASIKYSARRSMDEGNLMLTNLMAISRHKDLTILFITQHLNLIDINIFRLKDIIFHLRSSDYVIGERGGKHKSESKFYNKIRNMMMPRELGECLFEMPSKRRFINFKYPLPECWTSEMSKLFKGHKFDIKEKKTNIVKDVIKEMAGE